MSGGGFNPLRDAVTMSHNVMGMGSSAAPAPSSFMGRSFTGFAQPMQQPSGPMLTGGLQQMAMLNAYRGGAPMSQINAMNPHTPRPAQFLPPGLPAYVPAAAPRWSGPESPGAFTGML